VKKWVATLLTLLLLPAAFAQTDAVLTRFREAVRLAPSDARARVLLGTALLDRGKVFEALRNLRKAAELAPNDPEYAYQLGRAYQRVSEWSVERMRAADPESARLYLTLGESYAAERNTDKALDAFHKAAARAPRMTGVHLAMAALLAAAGKREEALAEVHQELIISPGSASAEALQRQLEPR
jgi:protein O-GlcNAc transferase